MSKRVSSDEATGESPMAGIRSTARQKKKEKENERGWNETSCAEGWREVFKC